MIAESNRLITVIGELIDLAGVAIIAAGVVAGSLFFLRDYFFRKDEVANAYGNLRTFLGRTILLGLEFLVAGDIIKTVAVEPTMDSVLVLAVIVLVRTVLSLSIDVEIDGRWPWQAAAQERAGIAAVKQGSISSERMNE